MDTKSPTGPPDAYDSYTDSSEAPPSYNDTISSFPISTSSSSTQYYSTQIASQLQTLTSQISSLQTQKSLLAHAQEEKILSCLTTHIQTYLSDFASTGLKKGTLVLVPANGLKSQNAVPTDYDFRDPEEYDRVVRVRAKEDAVGEGSWFWQNEEMAIRLASCLKPTPDPRTRELPPRKEEVKKKEESRGFWGRKKSVVRPPLVEERRDEKIDLKGAESERDKENGDKVVFDVKAEEVCFRTENQFGIYETESGWGIVLDLKVVFARS